MPYKPTGMPNGRPPKRLKKHAGGRPKKEIPWEKVAQICAYSPTMGEIYAFFDVDVKTMETRCLADNGITFREFFQKNSDRGTLSLRAKAFKMAHEDNSQIMLHLLKTVAKLNEKIDLNHSGEISISAAEVIKRVREKTKEA